MELLPVGSVVLLENAEKRLVIMGIMQKNGDGKEYDYIGVPYPEGIIGMDSMFMFNHSDIKSVGFIGYQDIERQLFVKAIDEKLKEESNKSEN